MTGKKTNIGGIEISNVRDSNLTVKGDITTHIQTGGGDVVGRDKITHIRQEHYDPTR